MGKRISRMAGGAALAAALVWVSLASAQDQWSTLADKILADTMAESPVALPGLAASVWKDGVEVYAGAEGFADVNSGREATPDTRFRIYSSSKPLTAVAAFRLAEKEVLALDQPITAYLPNLPEALRGITARQLLAHRSGVRHYRGGEWLKVSSRSCGAPGEALPDFIDDPLLFPPGTETQYTSFGYVLLSAVLQAAAGKPYSQVMADEVFVPAGMKGAALEGRAVAGYETASFYLKKEADGAFVSTSTLDVDASCKFGGGGFVATARDLAAFGSALIEARLLSDRSLKAMTTVVTPAAADGSLPPMAYGIFVEDPFPAFESVPLEQKSRAFWHGGSGLGGYSVVIAYPDKGVSAAMTTNVLAGGFLIVRAHDLATLFFDNQPRRPRYR